MQPRRAWVVSEAKIGTLSQCVGLARYFDPKPIEKIIIPRHGLKRIFAPEIFRRSERMPDIIVSCGYKPEKTVLRIRKAFSGKPVAVHLQKPYVEGYDLVFVSRHDWTDDLGKRSNYFSMVGVPHRWNPETIAGRRPAARAIYSPDDARLAAFFVGGSNGAYAYDTAALENIRNAVQSLTAQGWRVLVSASRRSNQATVDALLKLRTENVIVWDRASENPYFDFVAAADAFLIAKDSITMPCEALATGRPVYAFDLTNTPGERLDKFERFHRDLQEELRLTRPFRGVLEDYAYAPLDETRRIASIIDGFLQDRHGV